MKAKRDEQIGTVLLLCRYTFITLMHSQCDPEIIPLSVKLYHKHKESSSSVRSRLLASVAIE